ncbi:hypothetical protein AB0A73_04100 [Glycomyces sp. NPDC047369]
MDQHSFTDRAGADAFVAERFPGAVPMPALTALLRGPILVDADQEVLVRLYDWSDDSEDPVVNVNVLPAREWIRDADLIAQVDMLLDDDSADPARVGRVLEEMTAIGRAAVPPVWKDYPVLGLHLGSDTLRAELESALTVLDAVRDRNAATLLDAHRAAGTGLVEAAAELHLKPRELAAMASEDYLRTLDPHTPPPGR